jgi:Mrp family chromosome partitioning ATPase
VATFAGKADGVILVAQKSNMRGPAMSVAREKLQRASAQILGAVLNRNRAPEQYQRVA